MPGCSMRPKWMHDVLEHHVHIRDWQRYLAYRQAQVCREAAAISSAVATHQE